MEIADQAFAMVQSLAQVFLALMDQFLVEQLLV
jgi:hypothetical protein